ncbi:MAG TPA: helix-turn-helix transcriptional regulator [Candidatus Onthocola stercorigallinarum]|nr:helix-turn-helix transcriptional regulator [Candidatus Onthocola stercorigallinarum]
MNRLKELRESKDLLAKDVADYLRVDEDKYNEFEASKDKMPANVLIDLAKFYNTSIDYILYQTDVNKPYPEPEEKE